MSHPPPNFPQGPMNPPFIFSHTIVQGKVALRGPTSLNLEDSRGGGVGEI